MIRFLFRVLKLSNSLDELEKRNEELYAIVHSHIKVGAYFSEEDKKQMTDPHTNRPIYPAICYLVANVNESRKVDDHALFYFSDKEGVFLQANLKIT